MTFSTLGTGVGHAALLWCLEEEGGVDTVEGLVPLRVEVVAAEAELELEGVVL